MNVVMIDPAFPCFSNQPFEVNPLEKTGLNAIWGGSPIARMRPSQVGDSGASASWSVGC